MLKRIVVFAARLSLLMLFAGVVRGEQASEVLSKKLQDIQVSRVEPYEKASTPMVEGMQYSDTSASKKWIVSSESDKKGYSTGIWLTRIATKEKRKLIEPSTLDVRWSPTKDEFLCELITRPKGSPGWNVGTVWLVDTTGTKKKIYDFYGGLHWSPDGEKIMIAGCDYAVVVLDRNGNVKFTDKGLLTNTEPGGVWAPDSRHIAYAKDEMGYRKSDGEAYYIKSEISIADIETGDKKILIPNLPKTLDYPLKWDAPDRLLISRESLKEEGTPTRYLYWILK